MEALWQSGKLTVCCLQACENAFLSFSKFDSPSYRRSIDHGEPMSAPSSLELRYCAFVVWSSWTTCALKVPRMLVIGIKPINNEASHPQSNVVDAYQDSSISKVILSCERAPSDRDQFCLGRCICDGSLASCIYANQRR